MKKLSVLVVVASALFVSGCQDEAASPSPGGAVAVFDINKVALETGLSQGIDEKLVERNKQLQGELKKFSEDLKKELEKQAKKLNKKDKDRKKKVVMLQRAAQVQFNKAQAQGGAIMKQYQLKLVKEARDKIRPVAQEVARAKGFKVILLKNQTIVYDVVDEADLTDEILARYQEKHPDAKRKPEVKREEAKSDELPGKSVIEVEDEGSGAAGKEKAAAATKPKQQPKKVVKKTKPKVKKTTKPKAKPAAEKEAKTETTGSDSRLKLKFQEGAQSPQ